MGFINKLNEKGEVLKTKARLVAQSYGQQEGIDYTETFSLLTRIEAINLNQMDVNSIFLNGYINKEVMSNNHVVWKIMIF